MPDHLKTDYNHLQSLLQGYLSIHNNLKDAKSWGNAGIYTVKAGYNEIKNDSRKESIWKNVWNRDGLPEINFFVAFKFTRKS